MRFADETEEEWDMLRICDIVERFQDGHDFGLTCSFANDNNTFSKNESLDFIFPQKRTCCTYSVEGSQSSGTRSFCHVRLSSDTFPANRRRG